ncbi:MAG TPA: hypothetical protein VNI84_04470 [Pyrinomonadaceae bacterium]|nr:hypothetical protein [Pyrinomonadaceae bacterium]
MTRQIFEFFGSAGILPANVAQAASNRVYLNTTFHQCRIFAL